MAGIPGAYGQALIPRNETAPITSAPFIDVAGLKVPYTASGTLNGTWAKTWLTSPSGVPNTSNGALVLGKLYESGCITSSTVAAMNENKQNYCLVLEAVGASSVYRAPLGMAWLADDEAASLRGSNDKYPRVAATAYGMAYYCEGVGYTGDIGSGISPKLWNTV